MPDFYGPYVINTYSEKFYINALKGKNLFDEANRMLREEIDLLMEMFRTSDAEFYNEYQAARVIRDQ